MDRKSMQSLKLDRRLLRRSGWISQEELDAALEQLPDVSGKAADLNEETPVSSSSAEPRD